MMKPLVKILPQLVVAGSLGGSALVMKFLPLAGLAPAAFKEEIMASYAKFVALPLLKPVLALINMQVNHFMWMLALCHLVSAALLLWPKGQKPARVAGIWAAVAMAGAEYCTRSTDAVPPMTPPEWKSEAKILGTMMHAVIFLCGVLCCCGFESLGWGQRVMALVSKKANVTAEKPKGSPKSSPKSSPKKPNTSSEAVTTMPSKAADVGSKKRSSTPPAKAKTQK